jgi:hypothetical protein
MAELFKWEGTYDDTVADSGETISGVGLSAGAGDGGADTTDYNATGDRMEITGLSASSGILQQGSDDVLDLNQGTLLLRASFDSNSTNNYHIFGHYSSSIAYYFYVFYNGNGRLYFFIQDGQDPLNQSSAYLLWTPTISMFYDIRVTWDMSVDNSIEFSIDGATFASSYNSGGESNVVISDIVPSSLRIGNRSTWSLYEGEISRCLIGDVYRDLTLGDTASGVIMPIFSQEGIHANVFR